MPENSNQKKCNSCESIINKDAKICHHCGVRQHRPVNKITLLLITFFFGVIGIHKFYLGKYWQGIFYLLLCWTIIPGILAIIDFIIYACTSSDSLNGKYSAEGSMGAIVILFVFCILIFGIFAAPWIPGYQAASWSPGYRDYYNNKKVAEGLILAAGAKSAVSDNANKGEPFTTGWSAPEATDAVSSVVIDPLNGEITISYTSRIAPPGSNTLVLSPHNSANGKPLIAGVPIGSITWSCNSARTKRTNIYFGTFGTIASTYVPANCRD